MDFLLYLLQVHIALALCYALYKGLFNHNTHLVARRLFLLSILLFAVVYPLFRIPSMERVLPSTLQFALPELRVGASEIPEATSGPNLYQLAAGVYGGIAGLLVLRMMVRILSIVGLRRNGRRHNHEKFHVIICPNETQPCSFFNWIFLPASAAENPVAWNQVMKHEYAHIRQMHSADILLAEGVAALCWINPVAWLLLKEVRLNLECLADRAALHGESEKKSYQYLLLDLARAERPHTSAMPFNYSFLKERIAMINRPESSRLSLYRYLLVIPLFVLLVVGSQSCRESPTRTNDTTPVTTPAEEAHPAPAASPDQKEEPVLDAAEVMPEFPGGGKAFFEFIARNLQYPQEAIDRQIEGRVILQFVVDKQGKISDIQVLRGVTPELDQAAIDVMRTLPDWKPGMQDGKPVNVKYTMPIVFKLS